MPTRAAIAIGSNLAGPAQAERAVSIARAVAQLALLPRTRLLAAATPREYPALRVGTVDPGGPYLNSAATIDTDLAPLDLLDHLQRLERDAGRDRSLPRGSPRVLDLDLVLFGDHPFTHDRLTIPHPGLTSRAFVLEPLAEIAPDWPVPPANTTVAALLAAFHTRAHAPTPAPRAHPPLALLAAGLAALLVSVPPAARAQARPAPAKEPAADRARSGQPAELPADAAWAEIRRAYATGPTTDRVAITVRVERGSRRDEVVVRLDPAAKALALELGTLRAWAGPAEAGSELIVTDVRAGESFLREVSADEPPYALLARALPPVPLPQIALALDESFDPRRPLGASADTVDWTSARLAPDANPPTLTITGTGPHGDAIAVADARTGRLRRLTVPVADGVTIDFQCAPEPAGEVLARRPSLAGRHPVASLAELRAKRLAEPAPGPDDPAKPKE